MHSTSNAKTAKRDVVKLAKERGVRFVRLNFADILGVNKSVTIPVGELERAMAGKITFDGGSIDGFVRGEEADMILVPDPGSFAVYPWTEGGEIEARLICDIATPDGQPFEGCPRSTLKRVLEDARDVGLTLATSVEMEFYLFTQNPDGTPTTESHDSGSYFDLSPSDRGEDARSAIVAALEKMGIGVETAHHEHGAGQHEVDLVATHALKMADHMITFRTLAKHVASQRNLHATFMPKPLEGQAGSGLHIYFALRDETRNVVGEDTAREGLSDIGLYLVGGLLEHAPAATAICNPTVNSYKRLVPNWDAPIYTVWSHRSANALVRVPFGHGDDARVEMRSPDASCNPYLALAVLIESAMHGIRTRKLPGDPWNGTSYDLNERVRAERGIRVLPKSLRQALDELDKDHIVRGALGDHIYHAFREAKLAEYERYRRAVHPWERDAYLSLF